MRPTYLLSLLTLGATALPADPPEATTLSTTSAPTTPNNNNAALLALSKAGEVRISLSAAINNAGIQVGALLAATANSQINRMSQIRPANANNNNKRDPASVVSGTDLHVDSTIRTLTERLAAQADAARKHAADPDSSAPPAGYVNVTALVEGILRAGVGAGACGQASSSSSSSSSSSKKKKVDPRAAEAAPEPQGGVGTGLGAGVELNALAVVKTFMTGLMVGANAKVAVNFGGDAA